MSERFWTVFFHEGWDIKSALNWLDDPTNNVPVLDNDDDANLVNINPADDGLNFVFRNRTRALMFKLCVVPR